jgi:hypothetical protein
LAARGEVEELTVLVGQQGKVVVGELTPGRVYPIGYFVDVLDATTEVAAMAVSVGATNGNAFENLSGWTNAVLTPAEWNTGFLFSIEGTSVSTNSLGTANSIFGSDPAIVLYWLSTGTNVIFDNGTTSNDHDQATWDVATEYFGFSPTRRSEFIALDINGQIIDYSVPEPATLLLVGLAAGVGCLVRRRS